MQQNTTAITLNKAASAIVVALMFMGAYVCTLPMQAHANGKPETTGQDRAASVGKKSPDEAEGSAKSEQTASAKEAAASNTKAEEKAAGHDRAVSSVKREEIQSQISMIKILIEQMRSALDGGGIGQELSEFIKNGRVLPGVDDGEASSTPSLFVAQLASVASSIDTGDASSTDDDVVEYSLDLEISASSSDLVIPDGTGTEATSSVGIVFNVVNASGTIVSADDVTSTLTSTAVASSSVFTVDEGTTETFTVSVAFNPAETGGYQIQLTQIQVNGAFYDLAPASEFQSELVKM